MRVLVLLLFWAACAPRSVPKQDGSIQPKEGAVIEMIEETAVGMLGRQRVPMANVTKKYKFKLPDGSEGQGPACMLMLPKATWVGVGSEVEAGGYRWRVIEIKVPDDDTGSIYLERLDG